MNKKIFLVFVICLFLVGSVLAANFNIFNKSNPAQSFFAVNGTSGNIGLGKLSPTTLLQLLNDRWISADNAAGDGIVNMFKVNSNDEIEVGATLNIGNFEFSEDSGLVAFADMPVSATPSSGTVEGYTFKVDGDNIMTVYSEADSSGGIQNKRVGIGTSSPGETLEVSGTINASTDICLTGGACLSSMGVEGANITQVGSMTSSVAFGNANADDQWLGLGAAAGRIEFDDLDTDEVNILGANVGIGTTGPASILDLSSTGAPTLTFSDEDDSSTAEIAHGSGNIEIRADVNSDTANGNIKFFSQGSELVRVQSNGNVGIGTTTPGAKLDVNGTVAYDVLSPMQYNTGNSVNYYKLGNLNDLGSRILIRIIGQNGYGGENSLITYGAVSIGNADNEFGAWQYTIGDLTTSNLKPTIIYNDPGGTNNIDVYIKIGTYFRGSVEIIDAYGFTLDSSPQTAVSDPSGVEATEGYFIQSNVGIGTSSPSQTLDVHGRFRLNNTGNTPVIYFTDGDTTEYQVGLNVNVNGDWSISETGSGIAQFLIQNTTGNVGIGTSSPDDPLHVYHETGTASLGQGGGLLVERGGNTKIELAAGSSAYGGGLITNGDEIFLTTNNDLTSPEFILQNGNVGIGTTSPDTRLHTRGAGKFESYASAGINEVLQLVDTANYLADRGVKVGFYVANGSNGNRLGAEIISANENTDDSYMSFTTESNGAVGERLRITSTGNVGIGTDSPTSLLELNAGNSGTAGSDMQLEMGAFGFRTYDDGSYNHLILDRMYGSWQSNPSIVFRADGNVGIGTSSPDELLDVEGYVKGNTDNLISSHSWIPGTTGNVGRFTSNGDASENSREWGIGPHGQRTILWKAVGDTSSGADGGWNSDYFAINHTKTYRYTVWIKKTTTTDGTTYFGTHGGGDAVTSLAGAEDTNPYFWSGDLPSLDKWYLLVGYVHGSGDSSTTSYGGIYDGETGEKVISATDFKFQTTTTSTHHRAFLYYSTSGTATQYFWDPRVEMVTGQEPTIEALLGLYKGATQDADSYFGGNVGIGTSSPAERLTVKSPGNSQRVIMAENSANTQELWNIYQDSTGSAMMSIYDSSENQDVKITTNGEDSWINSGNVGIGTTSPSNKLHVAGNITIDGGSDANTFITTAGANRHLSLESTGAAGAIRFFTENGGASTERMRVNDDGNVGIGTTSPDRLLHLKSIGSSYIRLEREDTTISENDYIGVIEAEHQETGNAGLNSRIAFQADDDIGSGKITFWTGLAGSLSEQVVIDNNGNVGIGTTSPGSKLFVNNSASNLVGLSVIQTGNYFGASINTENSPTGAGLSIQLNSSGTDERGFTVSNDGTTNGNLFRVETTTGNVGIGTTSPTQELEVSGDINATGNVYGTFVGSVYDFNAPGENLLRNGDFEHGTENWNFGSSDISTTDPKSGAYHYAHTNTGTWPISSDYIPIDTNKTYKLEAWVRQPVDGGGFYLGTACYDKNQNSVSAHPGSYDYWVTSNVNVGSGWNHYTGYRSGEDSDTGNYYAFHPGTKFCRVLFIPNYNNGGGTTYVDDIKFTEVGYGRERIMIGERNDAYYDGHIVMASGSGSSETDETLDFDFTETDIYINPSTGYLSVGGNVTASLGMFPKGIIPTKTGAADAKIFSPSGQYSGDSTWGIKYNEGTPDYIEFWDASQATAKIALDNGQAYFGIDGGNLSVGADTTNEQILDLSRTDDDVAINYEAIGDAHWIAGVDWISDSDTRWKITKNNAFGTNDYFTVDDNGNVGIGTSSPSSQLQISNNVASGGLDTFSEYQLLLYEGATAAESYGLGVKSNTLAFNTNTDFDFDQDGSTVMTINNGNVGIGTSSPLAGVSQTNVDTTTLTSHYGQLALLDDSAVADEIGGTMYFGGKYTGSTYTTWAGIQGAKAVATDGNYGGELRFFTRVHGSNMGATGPRMVLDTDGNVGIGTTSPGAKLHVNGSVIIDL